MRKRHGYRSRSAGVRRTPRKTTRYDPTTPSRTLLRAELRTVRLTARSA
ncbi:hypothetical protein NFX46_26615 [Streptomyces phaeoluteigriseus]|uniref:50S ribosomal protein L34 n=1 Tax=Streptomyces phaeoluteigriseus TaxID=114686 RepID=A0ABY4ZDL2_9ACTN|nr:hypothetical protein [Streptomyces phaeoluteigriseus]USQ86972.1 hypothetical protein NFX46_26615 [Streptomyces phaeoluteigriseus]